MLARYSSSDKLFFTRFFFVVKNKNNFQRQVLNLTIFPDTESNIYNVCSVKKCLQCFLIRVFHANSVIID
jgi:hypothetical protein